MQLNDDEVEALRRLAKIEARLEKIADQDEKMEWFWGSVRRLASWLTIVIGATVLLWDQVKNGAKAVVRAMGL